VNTPAWVGLGANLGDAAQALRAAAAALGVLPQTVLAALSSVYRSAPIDSRGPDYLNAVALLQTGLSAPALLAELQRIEREHGRERPYRNAPRTLDLDLLVYADKCIATPTLTLPHPRAHLRAFVLRPLAEIAPEFELPGRGRVTELLARVADQRIEKVSLPGWTPLLEAGHHAA
jgi:2-amino-4-hydroxy-6-hydroxymethyldihydropteridine diphosphokinase